MLYNSINIISKRFSQTKIYCKFNSFEMDSIDETLDTAHDDDLDHCMDQYPFDVAAMNDSEYKFKNQNLFGRLIQTNEFIIVRCKIPLTGNIVSCLNFDDKFFFIDNELQLNRVYELIYSKKSK